MVPGDLYNCWRGIVAYFQPAGFFMQGVTPDKKSADFDEQCAALITQNVLLNKQASISCYLVPKQSHTL